MHTETVHRVTLGGGWEEIKSARINNRYSLSHFIAAVWCICLYRFFGQDVISFTLAGSTDDEEEDQRPAHYQGAISVDMPVRDLFENPEIIRRLSDPEKQQENGGSEIWLVGHQADLPNLGLAEGRLRLVVRVGAEGATFELHDSGHPSLYGQGDHLVSTAAQVARGLLADLRRKVGDIELVDTEVVTTWRNQHQKTFEPSKQTFLDAVKQRRREHPDCLAVCAGDGELTYAQLDAATTHFARQLQQQGVTAGSMVPLCFERSVCILVTELAILKAGAAFVPVDPSHPDSRLRGIIDQTKATVMVTSPTLESRMSAMGLSVVTCSSDLVSRMAGQKDDGEDGPLVSRSPQDPAYVLFTSGSTGVPSGCIVTHAGIANMPLQNEALGITSKTHSLVSSSSTFTMSLVQSFIPLAAGATVYVPSDGDLRNRLAEYMQEKQISWAVLTPTAADAIQDPTSLTSLKTLILGGEPTARHHAEIWGPLVNLHRAYGCTEWPGGVAFSQPITVENFACDNLYSISAGLWLVDPIDHRRLMPPGAVAELVLDGSSLPIGYLGEPEKTAKRFVDSIPWLSDPERRVYKTGDLVQYLPDGSFRYVARKDFQVKIRGMRVDLVDLETCVNHHCPSVTRVVAEAVVPAGSEDGAVVLAAFLYYENDQPLVGDESLFQVPASCETQFRLDVGRLNEELPQSLPAHMIPMVYLPLRYLPKTISGKVDRNRIRHTMAALSWAELQGFALQTVDHVPPQTATEHKLHPLFAQALRVRPEELGIDDSFLHYGGDSIKAMKLARLCRQQGLASITFQDILERPTVRQLSAQLDDKRDSNPGDEKAAAPSAESTATVSIQLDDHLKQALKERLRALGLPENTTIQGVSPCSHVQEGILMNQAREPSHYQVRVTYDITTADGRPVDIARLERAWKDLVRIHPMMRTIFVESTQPEMFALQVMLGEEVCESFKVTDHSPQLPDVLWPSLPQLSLQQANGGESVSAVLLINHAVTDGTSMAILVRDLGRLYSGKPVSPGLLYSDYITHLRQNTTPAASEFWTSRLAGTKPCLLPPPTGHSEEGASPWQRVSIPIDEPSRYKEFAAASGVTLASVITLAWGLTLRSITRSSKVCFGFVTSGRDLPLAGVEDALGPFINVLPFAMDIPSEKTLLDLSRQVQSDFTKALPHQLISLASIYHALGLGGDKHLFNTSVTFIPELEDEENEIRIEDREVEDPTEDAIILHVRLRQGKIDTQLKYWTRDVSPPMARDIAAEFSRSLAQIITSPHEGPSEMLEQPPQPTQEQQPADDTTTVFPPLPSPDYQPTPDSTLTQTVSLGKEANAKFDLATKLRLACALVMSQYSGSNDVGFDMTNSARAPVPQRMAIDLKSTVRTSLEQMQDRNSRLLPCEHCGLPYLGPMSSSHAADSEFQTLLAIQPKGRQGPPCRYHLPLPDLSFFTGYILLLNCQLADDAIEIQADFDSGAVPKVRVEQVLRQLSHLLGQIEGPENLDTQLADLDPLHPEDAKQLLAWNSPKSDDDSFADRCVHHAIQETCEKQPDAPAVCAWDGQFTYGELDQLSSDLAHHLRSSCGVRPETIVPIYSEKSRWVTVAILGVVKAGGAFVLLEPTHPFERLQSICDQTSARVIVTSETYSKPAADLVPHGTTVLVGGDNAWSRANGKQDAPEPVAEEVTPRNLLYIVFTSGSTGQPKGAMVEHRSCHLSHIGLRRRFDMGSQTRTLQFSSHAFDVSVWDHIGTLISGGCVCIPSDAQRRNELPRVMTDMEVNLAVITPSVARTLGGPDMVPTLKTLCLAGESFNRSDVSTWVDQVRLINGYGPAECAGITTVEPAIKSENDPRSVGWPNHGFSIWITDPENPNRLLPVGAVGEIVAEGPAVGRGYLKNPEKTAASFVVSPPWLRRLRGASFNPETRLYRTGDMGQFQPDGSILYLGRQDGQVKIRGQRLELSEVEHHVSRQFEGTPEVYGLVVQHGKRQTLVALVSGYAQGRAGDESSIFGKDDPSHKFRDLLPAVRANLENTLPPYMVPSVFLPIAWVPLTPTGKANRRLLQQHVSKLSQQELDAFGEGDKKAHREPNSKAEQILQAVFARTLGLEPETVSADDSFFKIGGDSITAMRLVGEARKEGVSLTVADVFRNPVLSALAQQVETGSDSDAALKVASVVESYTPGSLLNPPVADLKAFAANLTNLPAPFTPDDIEDILPATPWQADCAEGKNVMNFWIQLPESVDLDRLDVALRTVIRRHENFRTLFIHHDNQVLQVVLHEPAYPTLRLRCENDIAGRTDSLCKDDYERTSVMGAPLFRPIVLTETSSGCRRLILRFSHAQYDGTALGVALRDLSLVYNGGSPQSLAPSFAQTLYHRKFLQETLETPRFFSELLRDMRMTNIPVPPRVKNTAGQEPADPHNVPLKVALKQTPLPPDQEGIPVSFVAQAAWVFLLAKMTGNYDVVFGFVSHSRDVPLPHVTEVRGPCLNFVPARITIDPSWTVGQFVQEVQAQHVRIMPHATMDIKEVRPLVPAWDSSVPFGSVFNHINTSFMESPDFAGERGEIGWVMHDRSGDFARDWLKFYVQTQRVGDKLEVMMVGHDDEMTVEYVGEVMEKYVATIQELSTDYSRGLPF
ncbi:hypothetical protein BJX61DRAFT_545988 [Aspergillus egyptiacus]|nr:hypothetical protein BJX61DRAFT_545988 [Aspergillus egyptiacus]